MINLYKETLAAITAANFNEKNVTRVKFIRGYCLGIMTWDQFVSMAKDINYCNSSDYIQINPSLKIELDDGRYKVTLSRIVDAANVEQWTNTPMVAAHHFQDNELNPEMLIDGNIVKW